MTLHIARYSPVEFSVIGDRADGDDHDVVENMFHSIRRRNDAGCIWTADCECAVCNPDGNDNSGPTTLERMATALESLVDIHERIAGEYALAQAGPRR